MTDYTDDPYIYPGSTVLKNKYEIKTQEVLKEIEAEATTVTIAQLRENPIKGNFDLAHLQAIHKQIFDPVYEWAGELRTITIEKGTTTFCPKEKLERTQKALFGALKKENFLKGTTPEQFADRAAYYFGELNKLHPFREGNGRTQREFMYQLSKEAGHNLDLTYVDGHEMIIASLNHFQGNPDDMRLMFFEQTLKVSKEEAEVALKKYNTLNAIKTVAPRPDKPKNPDICNEYRNQAKTLIELTGTWPGPEADFQITKTLLNAKYPKFKIENVLSMYSPETASKLNKEATAYAKATVKAVNQALLQGVSL